MKLTFLNPMCTSDNINQIYLHSFEWKISSIVSLVRKTQPLKYIILHVLKLKLLLF